MRVSETITVTDERSILQKMYFPITKSKISSVRQGIREHKNALATLVTSTTLPLYAPRSWLPPSTSYIHDNSLDKAAPKATFMMRDMLPTCANANSKPR